MLHLHLSKFVYSVFYDINETIRTERVMIKLYGECPVC
jgi:hypothetical protein